MSRLRIRYLAVVPLALVLATAGFAAAHDQGPAKVGDVICFEVAYDDVVRATVQAGAQLLAVQTNNATFDESEANPVRPYIDLGGIKILPREGLNLRLEVEEQTKRIVAVGRGAKSEQNRAMAKALADALGGVIACRTLTFSSRTLSASKEAGGSMQTSVSSWSM